MGRGEQGDGEFHDRSDEWKTAGMIRPDAFFCPPAHRKKPAEAGWSEEAGDQSSLLKTPSSCSRLMNRL
ncbi:hypothetical protein FQZ97_1278770 [compost metagenome]